MSRRGKIVRMIEGTGLCEKGNTVLEEGENRETGRKGRGNGGPRSRKMEKGRWDSEE